MPRPGDYQDFAYGRRPSGRASVGGNAGTHGSRRITGARTPPRTFAGTVGYAVMCILAAVVLMISGFSYFVVKDVSGIGGSHAIVSGPSLGAQNILLMGLESRTDWNGNILPNRILNKLHAGSRQAVLNGTGGNATNTLILIHIFAGGKQAVGFSIPRDDWVNFADTAGPQQQGKIDQAYGLSLFYKESQLRQQQPNLSQDQLAFLGNEAGRKAAVATVERLTGVHIDHFAEVNLGGFYELAKVFGGVEVCLRHKVPYDRYSGAHFHRGFQHLDPAQSLSFVRQRHGLPNGDLDRTHRQQAFIDSVLYQLRHEGVLSDLTKIGALINVAKQYVITDSGWNLLDFGQEAQSLTGAHLVFHTLPITGYATIDGQAANTVDVASIKAYVHGAFYPSANTSVGHHHRGKSRPANNAVVDVLNGGHTKGLAAQVTAQLAGAGYHVGTPGNTSYRSTTAVLYGTGTDVEAAQMAAIFGTTATASTSVTAGHIEILLGTTATAPAAVPAVSTAGASPTSTTSPSSAIPARGPQGGALVAKGGIPCVN
jgi:LCP family protein required for cell wall assembly